MQVVLKIYNYYNDKLFGIFYSGFISTKAPKANPLFGLIKHGTMYNAHSIALYTAHSIACILPL